MVFDGYMTYGGVEVINTERLQAYVDNGIVPLGTDVSAPEVCEGLTEVMTAGAVGSFTTPMQDEAPWVDLQNPDTFDFAGVLPLEVTGLDGTTRTVAMTDTTRDGALPGRARRGPRTVGVTAVLIGRTSEGVQAGLDWLRRTLFVSCEDATNPCGSGADLEFLTACPGPVNPTADTSSPPSTQTLLHPNDPIDPGSTWVVAGGDFTDGDDDSTTLVPYAGESATLYGLTLPCTNGPATITWSLGPTEDTAADATIQLVNLDVGGNIVTFGPKYDVTGDPGDLDTYEWELPFGEGEEMWRPAIITTDTLAVHSLAVQTYTNLSAAECVAPYRRFTPNTVTTEGPTPIETLDVDCAYLLKVEWTWVVSGPYRYGVTEPLLLGMSRTVDPPLVLPGVTWDNDTGVTSATPWNCSPLVPLPGCAVDPCTPGYAVPPAPPVIADPSAVTITTQTIRDMWVCVGPEQTPANDGLFTFKMAAAGGAIVGARIRVYDNPSALCVVPDVCDFAYEFNINYIPDDSVLTIDGPSGQFITLCADGVTTDDASTGIRGAYGGPIVEPAARCNRRYLIRVQWLAAYPKDCDPFYNQGDAEGEISFGVYVTPREG